MSNAFNGATEGEREAVCQILEELKSARRLHPNFVNPHEAYAVILEELDEVWDIIKRHKRVPQGRHAPTEIDSMKYEIKAVGAMCIRFMTDL